MINDADKYKQPFGGALGQEFQRVWHAIKTNQVIPAPNMKVSKTTGGTILHAQAGGDGTAEIFEMTVAADVKDPQKVSVLTDEGEEVLLPQYLRPNEKPRNDCEIQPHYKSNDTIYCLALTTLGPNGEAYIDLNVDARRWAMGVTICQNNQTSKFWIPVVTP